MTAGSKNSPLTEEEAENRVRENPTFSLTGEASQTESQVNGTYVTPQRVFCCLLQATLLQANEWLELALPLCV